MAMFDIIGELSDAQDFFGTTTQAIASENVINLGNSDVNWGNAEIWINVQISTAFVGASSTTKVELKSSADATIAAGDTTVMTLQPLADLTGKAVGDFLFRGRIPVDVDQEAFIGVLVTNAADDTSAGALDIWLDHGSQSDSGVQKTLSNIT